MRPLSKEECFSILGDNYIGRLGYLHNSKPEIVPITFYFDNQKKTITSYSGAGRKIRSMRKDPNICLQADEIKNVQNWKSVMIIGTFQELSGSDAKITLRNFSDGVKGIISKKEHKDLSYLEEFSSKIKDSNELVIYQINIIEIKGMERNDPVS